MSTRVLIRDRPSRSIALVTTSHALIFRNVRAGQIPGANSSSTSIHSITGLHGNQGLGNSPRCIVELLPIEKADLEDYRIVSYSVFGTLGLITVDNDVFLCIVSGADKVATVRPGETIQRIGSVDFQCLSRSDYDRILNEDINVYNTDAVDEEGLETNPAHMRGHKDAALEHPCLALRKLLGGGSFYFSADFDVTRRLQDRATQDADSFDFDSFDRSYLWNSYMIKPLVDFRSRLSHQEKFALDSTRLITSAIRGFAMTMTIPANVAPARQDRAGLPSALTLISRLSCMRAGTRFNARGVDDDGNVANFVETETVYWNSSGTCFSYVQIRGSIPVFWEQSPGLLPGQQKVQITRSPQATQPAFDKHFEDLELKYGNIHVVNLLSKDKSSEVELSDRYRNHIARCSLNVRDPGGSNSDHRTIRETEYDFHAETRGSGYEAAGNIRYYIQDSADSFGYCLSEVVDEANQVTASSLNNAKRFVTILQQQGVFRTNCLDCLDRTNLVQTNISQMAFGQFLADRSERIRSEFLSRHGALWADNGDALSRIYAGTGALKSSFTRHGKMSLAGALADARKSATRMYINNFADKDRQNVMDMLLGRLLGQNPVYLFDPINDYVTSELNRRASEYSRTADISILVGTFNLNGKTHGLSENLSSWLCPQIDPTTKNPDIVAIGFQEIVELSPQQIMSTEPTRRQAWERSVKQTINANAKANGSEDYVLLRGGQLVGASLSIFVKSSMVNRIKNVEGSLKKTGMAGMAGNKGAVAIRMDVDKTSLCFVTAHLAAGFANYEERNRDYLTISHGLRFQRNRSIDEHDAVIWLGDFNYRIGLSHEKVIRLVEAQDWATLYDNDQLNLQMVAGLSFRHYSEARINFRPTYKYDASSDTYDTSEKSRIPAWCDRVLRKGDGLRQRTYGTVQGLRFSDHRPVYASFTCKISIVDEPRRESLSREIYEARRAAVGGSTAFEGSGNVTEDDGVEPSAPLHTGLPPASSEKRRWWLDNGMPARSAVLPPSSGLVPNPNRPSNPFAPTGAPDWVSTTSSSTSLRRASIASSQQSNQRRVPPPYNPVAASGPALPMRPMSYVDPSPKSSPNLVASSTGSISRKPAPPIPAKKPSLQSHPSFGSGQGSAAGMASPSRQSVSPPAVPAPRRSGTTSAERGSARGTLVNLMDDLEEKPPLPKRTATPMDDHDAGQSSGLSGWVPLKPS